MVSAVVEAFSLAAVRWDRAGWVGAHPTTWMKITTRFGEQAVDGLNDALLAKAVEGDTDSRRVAGALAKGEWLGMD
jgi:hypothetical protein